jgi:hypothetical protein
VRALIALSDTGLWAAPSESWSRSHAFLVSARVLCAVMFMASILDAD